MPRKKRRGEYGKGTVFKRKDRDTWSATWYENGVKHGKFGFESEDAARKHLAILQGDKAAGKAIKLSKGSQTLNQLADKWLADRKLTHRSAYDDKNRWDNHLRRSIGHSKPNAVDVAELKAFIAAKRRAGLSTTTVNLLIRLLSTFFSDLIESGDAHANPCRQLSKATRAKFLKPAHDPKRTPFLESMDHVVKVYKALEVKSPNVAVTYAVGALAGLRTSEARALDWAHIDLDRGVIHVQVQVERRKGKDPATWSPDGTQVLKDGESRVVPIQPSLASILATWRDLDGGRGLVAKPIKKGSRRFLDDHTMSTYLGDVLTDLKLARDGLGWYECTRHTMASQWVMSGGSLETLQRILGHSTVLVTERYAHLRPGHYNVADRNRLAADFAPDSVQLGVKLGVSGVGQGSSKQRKSA